MRTDDGYMHAWSIQAEIGEPEWQAMHADMILVLRAASRQLELDRTGDDLAVLRGPEGLGRLQLDANQIAFNGNAFLGQAGDAFSVERRARHNGIARVGRGGGHRTVRRCDTGGHPYDVAVCAVLLVALRHLGDGVRLGTSGSLRSGWGRAAALVRATIGETGRLVQLENGILRWIDAPAHDADGFVRSSAS
ncbi:MAG: hypothetical protein ABIT20_09575 [Gemmatimonadaceae bacterium]